MKMFNNCLEISGGTSSTSPVLVRSKVENLTSSSQLLGGLDTELEWAVLTAVDRLGDGEKFEAIVGRVMKELEVREAGVMVTSIGPVDE